MSAETQRQAPARPTRSASHRLARWRNRVRGDVVLLAGMALIVIQTAWHADVTIGSFFWQDDYRYIASARDHGLTWSFLFQDINHNGHLMPAVFLLAWLVSKNQVLTFAAPAASLIALQLVASALMLWVLTQLFPRRPQVLIGLAVYLFTPLGLVSATWWAFGLQALPLQIAILGSLGSYAMLRRTEQRRWIGGVVVSLVFGLAFWEKALLVGPLLLGSALLLHDQGVGVRQRISRVLGEWRLWLCLLLVATAYLTLYAQLTSRTLSTQEAPSLSRFFKDAILHTLLPGLLGGPWTGAGAENTLAATPSNGAVAFSALLSVVIVCWSFLRRGRAAALGWCFGVGYLLIDLVLVLTQRTDYAAFLARDPRYIADAIPVLVIAASAAFFPPQLGPRDAEVNPPSDRRSGEVDSQPPTDLPMSLVAVGAVVASCWVSVVAVEDVVQHPYARNYVQSLQREYHQNPAVALVDSPAPTPAVVIQPVSVVFRALGLKPMLNQPSTDLRIVDGFGRFLPVDLPDPEALARGPRSDCGWLIGHGGDTIRLPAGRGDEYRRVVRLGYLSGQSVAVSVSIDNHEPTVLTASDGLGYLYLVTDQAVRSLRVWTPEVGRQFCLSDVAIGQPWPKQQ